MVDVNIKNVENEAMKLIDKAATIEMRSRSNFMLNSSLEKATEIIALEEQKK